MAQEADLCFGQLNLFTRTSASSYIRMVDGCLELIIPSRSRSMIESTSASSSPVGFWVLFPLLLLVLMALLLCSDGLSLSGEVVDGGARLLRG